MGRRVYPDDLTGGQWRLRGSVLPKAKLIGGPRSTDLREVVNAILIVSRTGCGWGHPPHKVPSWPIYKNTESAAPPEEATVYLSKSWGRSSGGQRTVDRVRGLSAGAKVADQPLGGLDRPVDRVRDRDLLDCRPAPVGP